MTLMPDVTGGGVAQHLILACRVPANCGTSDAKIRCWVEGEVKDRYCGL